MPKKPFSSTTPTPLSKAKFYATLTILSVNLLPFLSNFYVNIWVFPVIAERLVINDAAEHTILSMNRVSSNVQNARLQFVHTALAQLVALIVVVKLFPKLLQLRNNII